jgi:predicted DNA-binding WGR domain protein
MELNLLYGTSSLAATKFFWTIFFTDKWHEIFYALLYLISRKETRMENLLTVIFEAHHAAKNHHRRYQVTLGRDLFDAWTVSIRYGRVGQAGSQTQFASPNADDIRTVIRARLRRRLSATQRIGCPYRLTLLDTAAGLDPATWLPDDVMARFSQAA